MAHAYRQPDPPRDGPPERPRPVERSGRDQGLLTSSFVLLRIRGIEIGAHWSWLFIFGLIAWVLATTLFPRTYPGFGPRTYWWMAITAAVIFFSSVLAHEVGHALTALRYRMDIDGITLWLFGGVARFRSMFPSPGAEFMIAIAGPAISLALALAFAGLAWTAGALAWPETSRAIFDYLARINAIVLAFNLAPALPLDGGRVLRAWLWRRQGSFEAATVSAARAGAAFGAMLVAIGVIGLFTEALTGSLWIALIGWFIWQAAKGEANYALIRGSFEGMRVQDLMTREPMVVDPSLTVEDFLERAAQPGQHSTYPVVEHDILLGMVSLRRAGEIAPDRRPWLSVADIMVPHEDVPTVRPDAPASTALEMLQNTGGRALVVDGDRLRGIVALADLARALEVRKIQGHTGPRPKRGSGILVWIVVALALLLVASAFYRPPVAVLQPGPSIDVSDDIGITGIDVTQIDGAYMLTTVEFLRPTALGALYALIHPDRQVTSVGSIVPQDVDPREFIAEQRAIFQESRMLAAAAAASALGMDVTIGGTGARVVGVLPDSPAAGTLRSGDVVVQVNGMAISTSSDLVEEITGSPAGSGFTLTIERDGDRMQVDITSRTLRGAPEPLTGIGVLLETRDLAIDLPFEVEFDERDIGGPSAGLPYALAIADLLSDEDLARGRTIAATGTINARGEIGAVGGVSEKAVSIAGLADVFMVPQGQADQARGEGTQVRAVRTLEEALRVLRQQA